MNVLTLETTCDETAAAVVTDQLEVRSSVVASQDDLHRRFGGVVPEIASRAHLERILPVIDEAIRRAGLSLADLDAVAVANTPGLAGSLLVGLAAAKALAVALDIPLVAVNHLQAHIYACRLAAAPREVFPCVGLIISGGHTSLYRCLGPLDFDLLGATIDDAAGEAFDKVAAMLGLGYPGGPAIQRAAEGGNPRAYALPRAFFHDDERLDFSLSGLKTAVRYRIAGPGRPDFSQIKLSPQQVADLAASFQEAVVDCLADKAFAALGQTGLGILCVGGGVAANARLRARLQEEAQGRGIQLHVAPVRLCTDNAVMGAIAVERLKAGLVEPLDLDAYPGVIRKKG
ncbi:MAG: tRNA (adenosine(37)-N6)-threonylcarbamoyltransferase complex transferase subunit TsaD [Thermoguttaceae bacterium]